MTQVPELTVIYWRDIPAQVVAKDGHSSERAQLADRFQHGIDAAAMKAGLVEMDAYLGEWRREARPCGVDLDAEVAVEVERIERAYTPAAVRELTRGGGLADGCSDTTGGASSTPAG